MTCPFFNYSPINEIVIYSFEIFILSLYESKEFFIVEKTPLHQ